MGVSSLSERTACQCRLLSVPARNPRFVQQRVKQAATGVVSGGEARLQPVTQGYQFIDLGDDAMLLGEGWERYERCLQQFEVASIASAFQWKPTES